MLALLQSYILLVIMKTYHYKGILITSATKVILFYGHITVEFNRCKGTYLDISMPSANSRD